MLPEPCCHCTEKFCKGGEGCPILIAQKEAEEAEKSLFEKSPSHPQRQNNLPEDLPMEKEKETVIMVSSLPLERGKIQILLFEDGKQVVKKKISRHIKRSIKMKFRGKTLVSSTI